MFQKIVLLDKIFKKDVYSFSVNFKNKKLVDDKLYLAIELFYKRHFVAIKLLQKTK